jgi:signal transduction histidine kinase/ActR/RegA family two-component response regulator
MLIIESSIKPIEIFFHTNLDDAVSTKEFITSSLQSVVKNLIFLDYFDEIAKYFTLNENIKILIIEIDKNSAKDMYSQLLSVKNNVPILLILQEGDIDSLNFLLSLGIHHFLIKDLSKDILLSKINLMYTDIQNQIELEKSQRELKKLNDSLEDKINIIEASRLKIEDDIKEKEIFLANISHEIRTPLNAMIGFVELLKDTQLDEKQQNYIETINYSSKNVINILNDVLDYSKIESNNLRIENICVDLFEELEEIVNLFKIEAYNKNLSLTLNIDEDVPSFIKTDPLRVKQIISNLVSNAIKFTSSGEVSIIVKMFKNIKRDHIEFSVKDTGIGIDKKAQDEIFQEFKQASESISRKFGGTGLGLSISTKLASLLGSSLQLQSKKDVGSRFYFSIPCEECYISSFDDEEELYSDVSFSKEKRVLVAEDIGTNVRLMREIFEKIGLKVDIANNGEDAFNMFVKNHYDIIFMDINMPIEDGLKSTFKILAYERKNRLENTPIVALTANALVEDRDNYLMSGMDDYLLKPISKVKILKILNKYL